MLEWLSNNPVVLVFLIVILLAVTAVIIYLAKGNSKAKVTKLVDENKSQEKNDDKNPDEDKPKSDDDETEPNFDKYQEDGALIDEEENSERRRNVDYNTIDEKVSEVEEKGGKKKHKLFEKRKKEVSRVFEPKEIKKVEKAATEEISEEEFLKSRQFVNSGKKKISKLVYIAPEESHEQDNAQLEVKNEQDANKSEPELQKPSRIRKIDGHFDHSRRLRKSIESDSFDDMFASHISGEYLTIESDRHLDEDRYSEKLFERTSQMIANSEGKVLVSGEDEHSHQILTGLPPSTSIKSDKDYMRNWLDQKRHEELRKIMSDDDVSNDNDEEDSSEEDLNLDSKNLLMVSSVMNRKKMKNKR